MSLTEPWRVVAGTAFEVAPSDTSKLPPGALAADAYTAESGDCWWLLPFDLDPAWDCVESELHIEGATRACTVWLNGARIGAISTAFIPGEFAITRLLRPKGNLLAVRLADGDVVRAAAGPAWDSAIDPRRHTAPALLGDTALAGFPAHRVERVRVWPDARRKLIEVETATNAPGRLHFQIEGTPVHHECAAGTARVSLEIPGAVPWAPGAPHCYALTIDFMSEDGAVDRVRIPFGLRELTVKEDQFHLNARPVSLRGVWHAPSIKQVPLSQRVAEARALLGELPPARMNGVRLLWPDEAVLAAADELGLLVYVQAPCDLDADAAEAMSNAFHHHASLTAYWLTEDATRVAPVLWAEDCTRLTLATGGGQPPCFYRPRKQQAEEAQAFTFLAAPPFDTSIESYWRRIGAEGRLVFIEALSAFGLEDAPDAVPPALEGVFDSAAELLAASHSMQAEAVRYPIDAFRLNPRIAGYWLQGLTPFPAWPLSALIDAAGVPRPVLRILEALHRPMRPVIQMEKSSLCVREEVHVNIALLNDMRIEGRGDVFLQVVGPTNQVLWKKRRQLRIPKHGKELWTGSVAASGSTGRHKFVVRLMQEEKVLGDSVFEFHVMETLADTQQRVHLVDTRGDYEARLKNLARLDTLLAPVHVLPPCGVSILAGPENELMQSLAQVKGGAVLLIFSPPADWNELAYRVDGLPPIELTPLWGDGRLRHQFSRSHPVWEGLPARGFLRQPYRDTAPATGLLGESDEAIAGWFTVGHDPAPRHTILSARYGQGRIVFVCFRLAEHLGEDPLADRAFVNLVKHFSRRAMAPRQPLPLEQPVVEWIRQQRKERLRRWMVIGEFPNPQNEGFAAVYPPEREVMLDAAYPGWRSVVRWCPWHTQSKDAHLLDFAQVFAPPAQGNDRTDYSVGYAYAEFAFDRRMTANFAIESHNACKVWLNGRLIVEQPEGHERGTLVRSEAEGVIKQGRNTMLVKLVKAPGPFHFHCEWTDQRDNPVSLSWWR